MNLINIINLTPHLVTIHGEDGQSCTLAPGGPAPRLAVTRQPAGAIMFAGITIPVCRPTLGETTGLPDAVAGIVLIVSALVAEANKTRSDLRSPGELVRDDTGVITGCKGVCTYFSEEAA